MNEQPQDNNEETGGEENRYNESDKPKTQERPATNRAGIEEDTSALYLTDNSTLQSPKEFKTDKEGNHSNEDDEISVSGGDDDVSMASSFAGDQAAAAADLAEDATNLNQGLEDQELEKYE